MDSKLQKILEKNLPEFVKQVNPQQLLIYLPCLNTYSKDEIETAQNSKSRSYAAQVLHSHLVRRPEGFRQLLTALRDDSVGCTELADRLDPNREHPVGYNGAVVTDIYTRQNRSQSDHPQHNSPPVSQGAAGSVNTNGSANTNGRLSRSSSKCDLNTPWDKLPCGIQTILKKFDTQQSLKKPEDLADKLGFNMEEIDGVKAVVQPGESLTLALLERWRHMQLKPVTLGIIMEIFYNLGMEYILQELEQKTDVKFDRRDERGASPHDGMFPQGGPGPSAEERNKVVVARTRDNHNINQPSEKFSGTNKMVLDDGANSQIPCNVVRPSDNAVSPQGMRQNVSEIGSRHNWHMSQNDSEIVSVIDDSSIEEHGDKRKNVDKFKGYREEDLVRNIGDDLHTQGNHFQQDGRSESYKISKTVARELSKELSSSQTNDGSGGFPVHLNIPDDNDIIKEKNNLDRSVSSSSSNTENSTYDSMPDTSYVNDLHSADLKKSVNPQSVNIINEDAESRNEENSEDIKDTMQTEITEGKLREAGSIQKPIIEQREGYKRMPVADNPVNHLVLTNSDSPQMVDDEDVLKADLSQRVFEEKMMATGQNLSDIISRSDLPESSEASMSVTDIPASSFSPLKTEMKIPKTRTVFNSIEQYVDYSLEDDRQDAPEDTNYSKELNSIEKKAAKTLPGFEIPSRSADVNINNDTENPSESFHFDWQLSEDAEAVSTGDENPVFVNQLSEEQLDQVNNPTLHQTDNGLFNTADEEMEFTRRGPDNQNMPQSLSNEVPKCEEAIDIVGRNASSEETVRGNVACLESVACNVASSEVVPLKKGTGETENSKSSLTEETENEVSDADIYRNNLRSNSDEDLKQFSVLDSFKTICRVVKVIYDNI